MKRVFLTIIVTLFLSVSMAAQCIRTETGYIMFPNSPANGTDVAFQLQIECRHGFLRWLRPRYDNPPGLHVYTFGVGMQEQGSYLVVNGMVILKYPPKKGEWVFFAIY